MPRARSRILLTAILLATRSTHAAEIPVTDQEIARMRAKLHGAQQYFESEWTEVFRQKSSPYRAPQLVPYRTRSVCPCGNLTPNNAFFCAQANTIFYDEVFLTRLMKFVGARLNTDGDYAPITVLAHEWGHAVQYWLAPAQGKLSYVKESEADCFAGAITRRAELAGHLDRDDVREGTTTLQLAGDAPMNGRDVWNMIARGHGTSVQRVANFRRGYRGGAAACNLQLAP